MNRFALRIKVQEAELKIRFDRRLDGTHAYSCDTCEVQTEFPLDDAKAIHDFWRNKQIVTLEFRNYAIPAVIRSWCYVVNGSIGVVWQSVGPLVAL